VSSPWFSVLIPRDSILRITSCIIRGCVYKCNLNDYILQRSTLINAAVKAVNQNNNFTNVQTGYVYKCPKLLIMISHQIFMVIKKTTTSTDWILKRKIDEVRYTDPHLTEKRSLILYAKTVLIEEDNSNNCSRAFTKNKF